METLYINKTIEIEAPAEKVWDIITKKEYSGSWVGEFSPGMTLESDWKVGDSVLWKEPGGKVVVEGNVIKIEPGKLLHFTVFDMEEGRHEVSEDDGMTFELIENGGKTTLHILHGDFAAMKEGQKYYDMTLDAWNKILPKIKELSEK